MLSIANQLSINWKCKHTWKRSSYNTSWCLLGCSIGDFGTIAYFQFMGIQWPVLAIMILAIVNGLITSIILETIILSRQMAINIAFKTARHVIDINGINGNCNERNRHSAHRWSNANMVGFTLHVDCRFYYSTSI